MSGVRAVFLDRDGVLVPEGPTPCTRPEQLTIVPGAAMALALLRGRGFRLVVVTNQTVVARGLASLEDVAAIHERMRSLLLAEHADAQLDAIEVCPHHPHADEVAFRLVCTCRKPRPEMLLRASEALGLDLHNSVMVGDRPSDMRAGMLAGCSTVLIESGAHTEPPIVSDLDLSPESLRIDARAPSLLAWARSLA